MEKTTTPFRISVRSASWRVPAFSPCNSGSSPSKAQSRIWRRIASPVRLQLPSMAPVKGDSVMKTYNAYATAATWPRPYRANRRVQVIDKPLPALIPRATWHKHCNLHSKQHNREQHKSASVTMFVSPRHHLRPLFPHLCHLFHQHLVCHCCPRSSSFHHLVLQRSIPLL